ncbi:MAG: VWA domain-containing protein [Candidatus Zixiibacteriota bacterium]|nr:MAG: VWA domain-containing protein [candidate division Zixibacteria bacterium]
MRFVYSEWDDELYRRLKNLADLMAIFNYLLIRLNGDVEETLKLMRRLQQQGYIDSKYDLDEFEKKLKESRLVRPSQGGLKLAPKGERRLRQDAFEQIFQKMKAGGKGQHALPYEGGSSEEPLPEKREFGFGDSYRSIDYNSSLFNTIKRSGGFDLSMSEKDLEVFESEWSTSCATVLMIDISHSMILYGEDRITPAKQVAMAFTELVLTKYPRDSLSIVLFGDTARQVSIRDLPYIAVGPYHTNTQAGLRMARQILLSRKHVNRQIFMITDGKPSMITRPGGQLYRNPMGLDPMIVNRTLDEAVICRKKKIPITTFMVTDDPYLQKFVQRLTELNNGRAYFSSADNLGSYVIWDFVSNRRRRQQ